MVDFYRQIGCAVVLQAARDFFKTRKKTKKEEILKDLRSDWCDSISNGLSVILADKLEKCPEEIKKNLQLNKEES